MPLLEAKLKGGYVAKATIKGGAVTFHLTPFGQKRLLDAGIQADTAPLEGEINARGHRLYALTPRKIQLVEESARK